MLTPLDIENREFKRTMSGYNRDDVEEFMGALLNDYEYLYTQNKLLTERNKAMEAELNQLKSQTSAIQNAFVSAQSTADEMVKNATEQSTRLVSEAQEQANKIIAEANIEIDRLNALYLKTRQKMIEYKKMVEKFLHDQIEKAEDIIGTECAQEQASLADGEN